MAKNIRGRNISLYLFIELGNILVMYFESIFCFRYLFEFRIYVLFLCNDAINNKYQPYINIKLWVKQGKNRILKFKYVLTLLQEKNVFHNYFSPKYLSDEYICMCNIRGLVKVQFSNVMGTNITHT